MSVQANAAPQPQPRGMRGPARRPATEVVFGMRTLQHNWRVLGARARRAADAGGSGRGNAFAPAIARGIGGGGSGRTRARQRNA